VIHKKVNELRSIDQRYRRPSGSGRLGNRSRRESTAGYEKTSFMHADRSAKLLDFWTIDRSFAALRLDDGFYVCYSSRDERRSRVDIGIPAKLCNLDVTVP